MPHTRIDSPLVILRNEMRCYLQVGPAPPRTSLDPDFHMTTKIGQVEYMQLSVVSSRLSLPGLEVWFLHTLQPALDTLFHLVGESLMQSKEHVAYG
jgi:hypothetical protein